MDEHLNIEVKESYRIIILTYKWKHYMEMKEKKSKSKLSNYFWEHMPRGKYNAKSGYLMLVLFAFLH